MNENTSFKDGLKKITSMWTVVLNQQGGNAKENAVLQSLNDFYTSSNRQLQKDIDNNDFDDADDLRSQISVFKELADIINNKRKYQKDDFVAAAKKISDVYLYYGRKYARELEYRNDEQRRNYIETILAPLVFIEGYFEDLN
jgi:hypothetical protein